MVVATITPFTPIARLARSAGRVVNVPRTYSGNVSASTSTLSNAEASSSFAGDAVPTGMSRVDTERPTNAACGPRPYRLDSKCRSFCSSEWSSNCHHPTCSAPTRSALRRMNVLVGFSGSDVFRSERPSTSYGTVADTTSCDRRQDIDDLDVSVTYLTSDLLRKLYDERYQQNVGLVAVCDGHDAACRADSLRRDRP